MSTIAVNCSPYNSLVEKLHKALVHTQLQRTSSRQTTKMRSWQGQLHELLQTAQFRETSNRSYIKTMLLCSAEKSMKHVIGISKFLGKSGRTSAQTHFFKHTSHILPIIEATLKGSKPKATWNKLRVYSSANYITLHRIFTVRVLQKEHARITETIRR